MAGGPQGFRTILIRQLMDSMNEPNIKQYFVNDSDGDPVSIYRAQSAAQAGGKCLEQVLEYVTVSGLKSVQKIAWRDAIWSGTSWDIS